MQKEKNKILSRLGATKCFTFTTVKAENGIEAIYIDKNVWLSQKMMGILYNVEQNTINYHIRKYFTDLNIDDSVVRKFRIIATDGKTYNTKHYNLKVIIAIGNRLKSPKVTQFTKWANDVIEEYAVKGI